MQNFLQTYYIGVLKRLKSEIDLLNEIIPHSVTKGSANEESLINVIKNFIPKKYSIGSGIIIDSYGNRSRQIDIIVYDSRIYPNLFSQSSTSIYPVETVFATIEVKTFINKQILMGIIKNTKSVKQLKHYVNEISINQPAPTTPLKIVKYPTKPPISFLVAFRSDSNNPSTWKKRFENSNLDYLPEVSILSDIASVFFFSDISKKVKNNLQSLFFHLREKDVKPDGRSDKVFYSNKPDSDFVLKSTSYKSANMKINDSYPILTPERAFFVFLIEFTRLLDNYPKHISFEPNKYLDDKFYEGINIP